MIFDHDVTCHVHFMASIDRFSLIPSGSLGILDFPSLAAILSFTYSDVRDYLICIRDYIRYILYSTPLDPSIFIVVLIVLLLRFFEQESVQLCFHTLKQTVLTSQRIPEDTMKTQAG